MEGIECGQTSREAYRRDPRVPSQQMWISCHRILQRPSKRRSQPETSHEKVGDEGARETEKVKREKTQQATMHWSKSDVTLDSSSGLHGIAQPLFLVLPPRRPAPPTWAG